MPTTEIGAYEAKTTLPELLRRVQSGERFTITHRGLPVAELVPVSDQKREARRRAAEGLFVLMDAASPPPRLSDSQLRKMRETGRK